MYGATRETKARYSPAECIGCMQKEIGGKPDSKHVSTSSAERQNLTIRMHNRRFTRLTNAFSKRIDHPYCGDLAPLHLRQFCLRPPDTSDYPSFGRWRYGSASASNAFRLERSFNRFGPALGR
jgi:hypothetical protein